MNADEVLARLRALGDARNAAGMARFGITPGTTVLGVSVSDVRALAREIGTDHRLAQALWRSRLHEARVLATIVADPARTTEALAERWVRNLDSWDVCDQLCSNLLRRTPFAVDKALEWSERDEEFVKRAGFSLMCSLAVHDRSSPDEVFARFLEAAERASDDERNFVRKAVNWTLRQVGKRNTALHRRAVETARRIGRRPGRTPRWIAADALRELESDAVRERLTKRSPVSLARRPASKR